MRFNKTKKIKNENGSIMIESMIAIGLVTVGLVGIFGLVTRSTHLNKDVENRVVATYLAGEGIEVIKNLIDTNVEKTYRSSLATWNEGLDGAFEVEYDSKLVTLIKISSTSTNPLRLNKATGRYSYSGSVTTPYFRTVRVTGGGGSVITVESGSVITVESYVEWTADRKKNTVHLSDTFYNWRERATPQYNPG